MTRLALKPFPLHEGMADLAMMMLRPKAPPPFINQAYEMNALSQISIEDWNNLFHAVEARLSACVAADNLIDDTIKVTVLECVEALEQLRAALTLERQQRHRPD